MSGAEENVLPIIPWPHGAMVIPFGIMDYYVTQFPRTPTNEILGLRFRMLLTKMEYYTDHNHKWYIYNLNSTVLTVQRTRREVA